MSQVEFPKARIAGTILFLVAALLAQATGFAQQAAPAAPSDGLQAAEALEDVLVSAIASAERSVVAIARVRRDDSLPIDTVGDAFQRLRPAPLPRPGDPEFIPNEYATGVVVGAGLILTAHHVLQEDCEYWITTAGRKTYKVSRVRGADPRSDLAVLQVDAPNLVPIKFGDASKLKKGQIVIALGNPYAIARDGEVCASWGIIANLSRKDGPSMPERDERPGPTRTTLGQYGNLIQTDAKLNLGTSGGALLNLQGEMIGMTVSLSAALGYEQAAGFAIRVDETFHRALEALKQGSEVEYGFLGVELPFSSDPRVRAMQGAVVQSTVESTPAGRSLLQPGDLITQVNDIPVREADDLLLQVGKLPPGASVRLTIERDGRIETVIIPELAKYFVSRKKIVTNKPPAWRGIRVDYVTASPRLKELSDQRRIDPQGSVMITEVEQDSPAWNEGLRPEMMVSHVGTQRVTTPHEFRQAVASQSGPVQLRLSPPDDDRPERTIPPDAS
ncbi:MAG: trypsin-like peptidase domain-containing protein [Pirellulales bacterium]